MPSLPSDDALAVPRGSTTIRYSVVVPVYTNEGTLAELLERLCAISERLGGGLEAVLVVDGSPDSSLEVLRELLPRTPLPSRLLVHARNFGSFAAIRTGMAAARGEYVGVMAADLQEPPELMEAFFARLRTGEVDVVVGRRESRDDPALSALMSRVFWWLYRKAINPEFPPGGVDVFGCTREVALRLLSLNEAHSSLVGLLYWVGYRREEVPYSRLARTSGRSGWTLRKRVRYLLDSVFSFTDIPITMLSTVGAAGAALTALVAVVVFVGWATGRITETGYTPLMLTILFSTFSMLSALGIVGSYVWRAFENSKQRPGSIARTMETFHADD